jgi:hypothetical protein
MDARRRELTLSWADVRRLAGGITTQTLLDIRRGQGDTGRPKTLRNIELALRWAPGSFAAIDDGREPTALDPDVQFAQPSDLERMARGAGVDYAARLREIRLLMGPAAFWREIARMEAEESPSFSAR